MVWALLAGGLWAVANTLTVYAIRDVGLSHRVPALEQRTACSGSSGARCCSASCAAPARGAGSACAAGRRLLFAGAVVLALASAQHRAAPRERTRGIVAALGAGVLWGTMYIPYRKAYLTGMHPLSFLAFFTIGEVVTMSALAWAELGGAGRRVADARGARRACWFWLLLGGFVWVIGDLFQQYAAKYVGIGRGIPLSNTNQLWGLLWGVFVFGELADAEGAVLARVVAGSLLMAAGALAIALSSAPLREHLHWQAAAEREARRYGLDSAWVQARLAGEDPDARRGCAPEPARLGCSSPPRPPPSCAAASVAEAPALAFRAGRRARARPLPHSRCSVWCALALWRTTRFG